MKLKEYFYTHHVLPIKFAADHGISLSTIYRIMRGRKPQRRQAYKIESITKGLVTAKELLEVDDAKPST